MTVTRALDDLVESELVNRVREGEVAGTEAVKVLNQAVARAFPRVEEEAVDAILFNLSCTAVFGQFSKLSFEALTALLESADGNVELQDFSELVTLWIRQNEVTDEVKKSVLELVGFQNFHLRHLMDNIEKPDTALNKKIVDAIDHKGDACNSTISGLVADTYKSSSENAKLMRNLSEITKANKKMKDEVESFKQKLDSANKTIATQNAKIESTKQNHSNPECQ